ncbi:unnamed protein product [Ectocarpus fasciculatus]
MRVQPLTGCGLPNKNIQILLCRVSPPPSSLPETPYSQHFPIFSRPTFLQGWNTPCARRRVIATSKWKTGQGFHSIDWRASCPLRPRVNLANQRTACLQRCQLLIDMHTSRPPTPPAKQGCVLKTFRARPSNTHT